MNSYHYWFLVLKYPGIRLYIQELYIKNDVSKLYDFLMNIQIDDSGLG